MSDLLSPEEIKSVIDRWLDSVKPTPSPYSPAYGVYLAIAEAQKEKDQQALTAAIKEIDTLKLTQCQENCMGVLLAKQQAEREGMRKMLKELMDDPNVYGRATSVYQHLQAKLKELEG